jgi:hypothetical protein
VSTAHMGSRQSAALDGQILTVRRRKTSNHLGSSPAFLLTSHGSGRIEETIAVTEHGLTGWVPGLHRADPNALVEMV